MAFRKESKVKSNFTKITIGLASPEEILEKSVLSHAIDEFLETLSERDAKLFVRRYWYSEPVKEIAVFFGMTENAVTKRLAVTRKKLKKFLTGKGVYGNEER